MVFASMRSGETEVYSFVIGDIVELLKFFLCSRLKCVLQIEQVFLFGHVLLINGIIAIQTPKDLYALGAIKYNMACIISPKFSYQWMTSAHGTVRRKESYNMPVLL